MDMWLKEGLDPCLPDITGVEYLRDLVNPDGLGWCRFEPMGGASPHSWAEIDAFSRAADLRLEPWEARQIRTMSAAFVRERARGSDPMMVSPVFQDRPDEDPGLAVERRRVSDQLTRGLDALLG